MAMENVKRVVEFEDDNVTPNVTMDLTMADAYADDIKVEKAVEEVASELQEKAKEVTRDNPEAPEADVENYATKKMQLDESISDFTLSDVSPVAKDGRSHRDMDDDGMDTFLDYDMFDFIYGLVTDTYPKPKNPLDHKLRKFMYTGSDDYLNTNSNRGVGQVATDMEGSIVIYADDASDFDDIKTICELYKLDYVGPKPKSSKDSRWNFSFTIHVPMTSNNYPMMVEDYFATLGMTIADVMDADFASKYAKRNEKIRKDAEVELNELKVKKIFDEYVVKAANSNDDLMIFVKEMFNALDAAELKYSKVVLKRNFLAEFDDDFED